jgi:hypothetical protein
MPQLNDYNSLGSITEELTNLARDAAYVAVGLGVLGFQRAQVQRVELKSKLAQDLNVEDHLGDIRIEVARGIRQLDELIENAVRFVETTLEPIEDQLPPTARDIAKRAHDQIRDVRTQIRVAVVPAA